VEKWQKCSETISKESTWLWANHPDNAQALLGGVTPAAATPQSAAASGTNVPTAGAQNASYPSGVVLQGRMPAVANAQTIAGLAAPAMPMSPVAAAAGPPAAPAAWTTAGQPQTALAQQPTQLPSSQQPAATSTPQAISTNVRSEAQIAMETLFDQCYPRYIPARDSPPQLDVPTTTSISAQLRDPAQSTHQGKLAGIIRDRTNEKESLGPVKQQAYYHLRPAFLENSMTAFTNHLRIENIPEQLWKHTVVSLPGNTTRKEKESVDRNNDLTHVLPA
jgi:hypothetical protein